MIAEVSTLMELKSFVFCTDGEGTEVFILLGLKS